MSRKIPEHRSMEVFIIGSGWMGKSVYEVCEELGLCVVGVSAPFGDGKVDRLAEIAVDHGCPFICGWDSLTPDDIPPCDVILSAGNTRVFINKEMRDRAVVGAVGYHPSLLPRHRGGDSMEWTIRMHDPVSGGTLFYLDDGADTGDIIFQHWCFVKPGETAGELWFRELGVMGVSMFRKFLDECRRDGAPRGRKQDERFATWEPTLGRGKMGG